MSDDDIKALFEGLLGRKLGPIVDIGTSEDDDDGHCPHGLFFDEYCEECDELLEDEL